MSSSRWTDMSSIAPALALLTTGVSGQLHNTTTAGIQQHNRTTAQQQKVNAL